MAESFSQIAIRLGAKEIDRGINWTWANGFDTRESAEEFCKTPNIETRGVYDGEDGTFDVRFR